MMTTRNRVAGLILLLLLSVRTNVIVAAEPASTLQAALRQKFVTRLTGIVDRVNGAVGYTIIDLTSGDRLEALEQTAFPTASTIKLAILYEFFRQADTGALNLTDTKVLDRKSAVEGGVLSDMGAPVLSLRDYAILMVILSDNTATNVLIDALGMDAVNRSIQRLGLRNTQLRRHMIDLAAARRGDENVSTPADLAALLVALHKGDGLQPASHAELLQILKKRKVSALLRGLPAGVEAASKPGDLEGVRADTAIVYAKNRPYVFVMMMTLLHDEAEGERAIEEASRAAYEYFSRLGAATPYGRLLNR